MTNDAIAFPSAARRGDEASTGGLTPVTLSADAPWRWLRQATEVYRKQLPTCLGYGLLFVLIGGGIAYGLKELGLAAAMPVAVGAFGLLGPLMACGVYAIARAAEEDRKASLAEVFFPRAASPGQLAYLGVMLLVGAMAWSLIAIALYAMFAAGQGLQLGDFVSFALTTPRGIVMVIIGAGLGAAIAFGIFTLSAFSIPMLMDRETDFFTAIAGTVEALRVNRKAMLLWAWIIAQGLIVGGITLMLGFIVIFPLLGIATWIGYRETYPS